MNGLGYQIRSYCYVMDAINGIMTILLNGNSNDIYNVGSKKNIFSIAETKKIFSEYLVDDICKCSEKNLECDDYFLPNISKLEKIGWEEKIGMREMIQKSLSAYM
jgi:dTDP-D-glucose 4,6-dehydratase